jgi:hypothetical protein
MTRVPDGYSYNGGLAFQGQHAHGNTAGAEVVDPRAAQVRQAAQQTQQGMTANSVTARSQQMADILLRTAKTNLQRAAVASNRDALPGLTDIARAQRDDGSNAITENTGIVLT